jgi:hypothetical protein
MAGALGLGARRECSAHAAMLSRAPAQAQQQAGADSQMLKRRHVMEGVLGFGARGECKAHAAMLRRAPAQQYARTDSSLLSQASCDGWGAGAWGARGVQRTRCNVEAGT